MPCGPFERDKSDPFGWIAPDGSSHHGEWKKQQDGNIVWKGFASNEEWDALPDVISQGG
jgi:hypothetical protein